jgi:hypothetical protein
MLGLPISDQMTGRVIAEIFETPPTVEVEEPRTAARAASPRGGAPGKPTARATSTTDNVYSEEELQKVTERLTDLGYLE